MRTIKANGINIHYRDRPGREPALVFSNSLGTDFRVWEEMLRELGTDRRVILYDKRGHGLSDAPPAPYKMDDHIADLLGLLDGLEVGEAVIVGLSVGGAIAQGTAAKRPELVKGLVLMDTAHKIGDPDSWNQRIEAVTTNGIASIADPILDRWFSKDFRTKRKDEEAAWRNMLVRTTVDGYAGTCAALRDSDFTETTRKIGVPVLCICGSDDGATTPEMVKSCADLIDGSRFELVEGAGHLPCVEAPAATAALIRGFLEENGLG